jgi:hypothetical protein
MSETEREDPQSIVNRETNLAIFEYLYGAKREKLADDVCGLMHQGKVYGNFKGHENFKDEEQWEAHYSGPDFCVSLEKMFEVEELLKRQNRHLAYAQSLVWTVCPAWQSLNLNQAVLGFWFALAHASSLQRAGAAAKLLFEGHKRGRFT